MTENSEPTTPVDLLSDSPATDALCFDFDAYADTLYAMIAGRQNPTPFTVGINGSWGTGKTTLLKAIKTRLDAEALNDHKMYRRCKTVWFQPWKYSCEASLLPALVEAIFKAMASDGFFTLAKTKIDSLAKRINKSKVFTSISRLTTGVDISEFFSDFPEKEKLGFFDTFQKFFDDLIWTFLNWRFKLSGQEKPDDKKCALVILIDDPDRCAPRARVTLLEIINLFMHRSGLVFVLSGDCERITEALMRIRGYSRQGAQRFMEKSIQAVFSLPGIDSQKFMDVLGEKQSETKALHPYLSELLPVLDHNPRRFKRFITHINLLKALLQNNNLQISDDTVALWQVMNLTCQEFVAEIRKTPEIFFAIQEQITRLQEALGETPVCQASAEQLEKENVPPLMRPYLQHRLLPDMISRCRFTAADFSRFLFLCDAFRYPE